MQLIGFDTEMNELVFPFWFINVTLLVFDKSFLKYGGIFLFLPSIEETIIYLSDCVFYSFVNIWSFDTHVYVKHV